MTKKIDSRILLGIGIVALLSSCSRDLSDAELLARAQDEHSKNEIQASVVDLKTLLQRNPDHVQARYLLGQNYLLLGDGPTAEKELQKAETLGATDREFILAFAEAAHFRHENELALDRLKQLPAQDAKSSAHIKLEAKILIALGNLDEAMDLLVAEKGLEQDSQALALQGVILRNQNKLEEATVKLKAATEVVEPSSEAFRLYAMLLAATKLEDADIQAAFRQAITRAVPGSRDHWLTILQRAYYYSDAGQPAAALKDVMLAEKIYMNLETQYAKARILLQNGKTDEARAILLEIESRYRAFRDVPLLLGSIFLKDQNYRQADRLVSRYLFDHPKHVGAHRLLGGILFEHRQLDRARQVVDDGLALEPDDLGLKLISARLLLEAGESDQGIQMLQSLVDNNPQSDPIRFRLAGALMDSSNLDQGLEELNTLLGKPKAGPQIHLTKTLALMDAQRFEEAIQSAGEWLKAYPDEPVAYNLRGIAYLSLKQEAQAIENFERAYQLDPNNFSPVFNLGEIALQKGDLKQAEKWFSIAWNRDQNNLAAIDKMAKLALAKGDDKEYEKWLKLALRIDPEALKSRIALIKFKFRRNRLNEVMAEINEGLEVEPDQPDLMLLRCELLIRTGEPEQAVQSCRRVLSLYPNHNGANLLVAQAYMAANYADEAKFHLRKVLQQEVQNEHATSLLAMLLLKEKNYERAAPLVKAFRSQWPDSVVGLELEADLAHGLGHYAQAAQSLRQALKMEPSERNLIALAQVLKVSQPWSEVENLVREWLAQRPEDLGVILWMANAQLGLGQLEPAIANWKRVLEIDANHLIALNNLAWHLKNTEFEQSLEYAFRAYQRAPEVPAVLDTYALLLVEKKDWQQAQTLLSKAHQKQRNNPEIAYHLAMVTAELGAKEKAREILEPFIYSQRDFNSRPEAEILWQQLKP